MKSNPINNCCIVGSGELGCSLAIQLAGSGYQVNLIVPQANLDTCRQQIQQQLTDLVQQKLLPATLTEVLSYIHLVIQDATAFQAADIVFVTKHMTMLAEQRFWQEIEPWVSQSAILADCNTYLCPTDIQKQLQYPKRFVGLCFGSPVYLIPLVEIMSGQLTAQTVVEVLMAWFGSLNKKPVHLTAEGAGFISERLEMAVLREATSLIDHGVVDAPTIDTIFKYGLARYWQTAGPLAQADVIGLDVLERLSSYLYSNLSNAKQTDWVLQNKVMTDQLGVKSKQGFYAWDQQTISKMQEQSYQVLLHQCKFDQKQA